MTFDPNQYKTTIRQQAEEHAGGWNAWAPLLETWLGEATERMPDRAGAQAGSRMLDAAGAGCQSIAAGQRVGPEGSVLATDLSPAIQRQAAAAAEVDGLGNVTTCELDGQQLHQLPGESFDAAISCVGLTYFPDRHQALTGIHHALGDGGRFASFGALHRMLGSMTATDQDSVWTEIESAWSQFETDDGFVGPCELVVAGAAG